MEFLYKGVRGCAMTTPFDTAWALLKNEKNIVREWDKNRGRFVQKKLMPIKRSKVPRTFQTTFLDRGNLSFNPMLTHQRNQNARIARESNRREAVPSQIEIDPDPKSSIIRNFSLLDDEGNMISRIRGAGGGINNNPHIHDFYGETKEPYRRQGMYKKLLQSLIGAGFPVLSNERNSKSDAFHRKFMQNLPPNIEGEHITEDDGDYNQKLGYQQRNVPQFLDAQGQRSGLNRKDYGAIPIVNQQKQARNMDELAEQDRAKIQRGKGHMPEMLPLHVTQPMARNTLQHRFDPNFKNEYPPLYDGYYNNQGNFYDDLDEVVFEGNHP